MTVQSKDLSTDAWVGLFNDIKSWRWSFKNITLAETFWYPGQPDNQGGHQSCGSIDTSGYWWDNVCTTLMPFLCFNAKYNDSNKYIWISTPMTWHGARAYCRANYTDLAGVNSTADKSLLKSKVWLTSWFGLFRDSWKWVDGTNASTLPWINGQPNNYWSNENCAFYTPSNQTGDYTCNAQLPFFCHSSSPASERQIIKVKVKTDQDVYDPNVQSAILEMMHQKLAAVGMAENTTLSWRVQQDGKIFHKKQEEVVENVNDTTHIVC
ncbi:hypothetical protein P4O66_001897 [Electrophorus voltai]|uniref:C-type lectin domain-containing protein n=1 Tax=Electrophorus voltai TaxID=2609070 RepID=A0AAD9DR65_9TELE|nr:hypothetical protein P4O66_001897 [Electrophorus voltai]